MRSAIRGKTEKRAAKSKSQKADPALSEKTQSKVVRDSFSMIETDYQLISMLRARCLKLGLIVNKSQILRAGLNAINNLSDRELSKIINNLAEVKLGRPR